MKYLIALLNAFSLLEDAVASTLILQRIIPFLNDKIMQ